MCGTLSDLITAGKTIFKDRFGEIEWEAVGKDEVL